MDHSALWSAFLPDCGLFQSVSCRETDGGSQSLTVLLCRVNNRPLSHAMCLQQCTSFPVSGDSSTVREEVSKETHLMDIVCVCVHVHSTALPSACSRYHTVMHRGPWPSEGFWEDELWSELMKKQLAECPVFSRCSVSDRSRVGHKEK